MLTVRDTKFGKSRQLPLHPTHRRPALRGYLRPARPAAARPGRTAGAAGVHRRNPAALRQRPARLPPAGRPGRARRPVARGCRPRIHDLRHTFAVAHPARLVSRRRRRARPGCRCCRPTSATPTRSTPTGTCPPPRSCSPWPPQRLDAHQAGAAVTALAPTLQAFFTDRLTRPAPGQPAHHRRLPRHAAAAAGLRRASAPAPSPPACDITDLDAPLIGAFLDHLEHERGNSVRTRNARLAAIHSLFRFAALRHPEHAADHPARPGDPAQTLRPASSSPTSPSPRPTALLAAPDPTTWTGRRDHALLVARRPDRAAGLRTHRADLRRRPPRHRRPRRAATAKAARSGSPR